MKPRTHLTNDQLRKAGDALCRGEPLKVVAAGLGLSTVRLSVHLSRLGYRCGWHWRAITEKP
jgi:hypothetical protein